MFVGWLAAWQGDNGGLLFGRLLGRHKMSPLISPKKTYEGGAGAIVFRFACMLINSIATMALCYLLNSVPYCALILPKMSLANYLLLGLVASAAAVFGDLVESLIKRAGELKVLFPSYSL